MVMDRMMEFKKNKIETISTLVKMIAEHTTHILSFCRRATDITYFKISFSYEISSHGQGTILYDKTWEEGER